MKIPKIIHYCWLSGDEFPDLNAKCIASWREFLPDYEIILWNAERFDINSVPWVYQSFGKKKYAFAADYIRLYALYHHGGIYLDADVEVVKSFDKLLLEDFFIGLDSIGDLEAAIIGSGPASKRIKKCLDYYEERNFIKNDGSFDLKPLPIIMKENIFSVQEFKEINFKSITKLSDVTVFPSEFFSPKDKNSGIISVNHNSYSVHHFDGAWVNKNLTYRVKKMIHANIKTLFGTERYLQIIKFLRELKFYKGPK